MTLDHNTAKPERPEDYAALVERLGWHREHPVTGTLVLTNPDGPQAATAIQALLAEREADRAELAAVKAERDGLREAITSLLALGPDHDDWCGIGPIYNCTCDLHPVRQAARQALKGTVG